MTGQKTQAEEKAHHTKNMDEEVSISASAHLRTLFVNNFPHGCQPPQKARYCSFNMIYLEKPSLDKRLGFIVVNKSMRNSKEPWQNLLLLILFQVD